MRSTATNPVYATEGSAALKPAYCTLTVHEGGKARSHGRSAVVVRRERSRHVRAERRFLFLMTTVVLVTSVAFALVSALTDSRAATRIQSSLDSAPISSVTVESGDSLWQIAETNAVEGVSTQELVEWISRRNGLASSSLQPGQKLQIPGSGV